MRSSLVETGRSVIALLASIVIIGVALLSGPAFFVVWYWFLQVVALVVVGLLLRAGLGRVAPSWALDSSALLVSALVAIGITYAIAYGDGVEAALTAAQLAALCTLPVAAVASVLIAASRRCVDWADVLPDRALRWIERG